MTKTLKDTQRKLVENNHNLIYSYLNSHHLSMDAVEDWYGTAAIGLCKAALIYDESRGCKFSTLAYLVMDNEVKMIMRKSKNNVKPDFSIDNSIDGVCGCYIGDIIPDKKDCFYSIYLNDAINIATCSLSDNDKRILHMITVEGLSQREAANAFGVSQAKVSRVHTTFIGKIRSYFND